ncbi:Ankyrin repeat family protein [Rhynchospora pubera]|uniref:Ankyrin repeat family protein n=1 Tax=Rhynchospora pubera TaxID=906938 RepID=A0AAV8CLD1_9POAL|nr:Ankyrin repeat family protein [Rhynchospora pubera]
MSHETVLCNAPPNNNASFEQQPPRQPPQAHHTIVQPTPTAVPQNTVPVLPPDGAAQAVTNTKNALTPDEMKQKWFEETRGWIMVVAVLVASVTYTTGLNPPGGLWQDDSNGHEAGDPILHYKSPNRYKTFFYANATAFMASLVIIILLMNERFYFSKSKVIMLNISMVLGLVSLMISYAAGCARKISTSMYVIVLAVVVLLFVIYSAHVLPYICSFTNKRAPWMRDVVGPGIVSLEDSVHNRKERSEMTKSASV